MKKLTIRRRHILRAIKAAYIALFLAGFASYASADPLTGPGFTGSGDTYTANSGTFAPTYFYDPSGSYKITIPVGSSLSNSGSAYTHLIQFYSGTVTNSGSLYGTNDTSSDAIRIGTNGAPGTGGTVNVGVTNTSSGYIAGSQSGVYAYTYFSGGTSTGGALSFNNAGTVYALNPHGGSNSSYAVGLFTYNNGTTGNVSNTINASNASGTLSGGYEGLYFGNDTEGVNGTINNSVIGSNAGNISSGQYGIDGYNFDENDNGSSTTLISQSFTFNNSGRISGDSSSGLYFDNEVYENYYAANTTQTMSLTNSGSITGETGVDLENYNSDGEQGYFVSGSNLTSSLTLNNSGRIRGTTDSGAYLLNFSRGNGDGDIEDGTGNLTQSTVVTNSNSGSIQGHDYGLYAKNHAQENYFGAISTSITLNNSGFIGGENNHAAHDTGAYLYNDVEDNEDDTSETNSITVGNAGEIYGRTGLHAENDSEEAGFNFGATVVNSISISNSGYIHGSHGHGIEAFNSIYDTGDNAFGSQPASNSIVISNSGTVIGHSSSGLYAYNYAEDIQGDATNSMTITNSGTIESIGRSAVHLVSEMYDVNGNETSTVSFTNTASGYIFGSRNGIDISNYADDALSSTTVTNYGIIGGNRYGVYFETPNSTFVTTGGAIYGGTDAVYLGDGPSTVTIQGRSNVIGTIEGNLTGSTLNLNLILSPSQATALQTEITNAGTGMGTFTDPSGDIYSWDGFDTVKASVLSLETSVDSGLTAAAAAIDNHGLAQNQGPGSTAGAAADTFYVAAFNNPEQAMNELVGRQINQGIDSLSLNLNTSLASDVQNHLDDLLSGDQVGGINLGGIQVNDTNNLYAFNDSGTQLNAVMSTLGGASLAGTEMSTDGKRMVSSVAPEPAWGVWASGNVTLGNESSTNSLPGYRSTLGTPTLGFDVHVTPNVVVGLLASYTTGDAGFTDGSKITTDVGIGALYGTWHSGNWHVNGIAGGGYASFNNQRTTFGGTAGSSVHGSDILTDWLGGYDFQLGDKFTVTPEVGLQYTHLGLDSYTETGAGMFNLNVGEQDINSLRSHVGFRVEKAFTIGHDLTFIPELRAQWYHEFMDDSRGVATSLPGSPALGSFAVGTYAPQRDFALVGVGLNTAFTGYKGMPVGMFVNYNVQVGQSSYIANSVNAGVRFNF